jgi:hypothetical protein
MQGNAVGMLASESYLSRMQDGNVPVTDWEDGGQELLSLGSSAGQWLFV